MKVRRSRNMLVPLLLLLLIPFQGVSQEQRRIPAAERFFRFRPALMAGVGFGEVSYMNLPVHGKGGIEYNLGANFNFMLGSVVIRPEVMYERMALPTFAYDPLQWDFGGDGRLSTHNITVPLSLGYLFPFDESGWMALGIMAKGFYRYTAGGDWMGKKLDLAQQYRPHNFGWGLGLDFYAGHFLLTIEVLVEETRALRSTTISNMNTVAGTLRLGYIF